MKRLVAALALPFALFAFSACGSSEQGSEPSNDVASVPTPTSTKSALSAGTSEIAAKSDAKATSAALEAWAIDNKGASVADFPLSEVPLFEGNVVRGLTGTVDSYTFCVVNAPTGAWAYFGPKGVTGSGTEGAVCAG